MELKVNFPGDKKVDAYYQGFTIKTDQPIDEGGEGSAPEPFSLFIASIGTCTGYYVLSFCQSRKISTDNIELKLNFEKNTEKNLIENMAIDIIVPDDFPKNYKNALIKTASLCSVKKHLDNPPEININVIRK